MDALGIVIVQLDSNCFEKLSWVVEAVQVVSIKLPLEVVVEGFLEAILPWSTGCTGTHSYLQRCADGLVVSANVLTPPVIV